MFKDKEYISVLWVQFVKVWNKSDLNNARVQKTMSDRDNQFKMKKKLKCKKNWVNDCSE
jgi:hypothetical protein